MLGRSVDAAMLALMTMRFVHETLGQRVRFATGQAADGVAREVEALGAKQVMVIAGPNRLALARQVTAELPVALLHDEVVGHVPLPVAERARDTAVAHAVDALVSIGGIVDGPRQGGRAHDRPADRCRSDHLRRLEATAIRGITERAEDHRRRPPGPSPIGGL